MAGLNPFFFRARRGGTLAWAWLAGLLLLALLAPALPLPYAPGVPDLAHVAEAPSGTSRHWLGTDPRGCDVLSGLVFGARSALLLTLPATLLAAGLAGLAGGAAGFWGNRLPVATRCWGLGAVALAGTLRSTWMIRSTLRSASRCSSSETSSSASLTAKQSRSTPR